MSFKKFERPDKSNYINQAIENERTRILSSELMADEKSSWISKNYSPHTGEEIEETKTTDMLAEARNKFRAQLRTLIEGKV